MNIIQINESSTSDPTLSHRCVDSCKKLLAGIEQVKTQIANEFHAKIESHSHLFQLALKEAESLAWQTPYPHLLFPTLALEKVNAAASWQTRQLALLKQHSLFEEAT